MFHDWSVKRYHPRIIYYHIYYRAVSQLKTEFDTTLSFVFKLLHFKLKVLLIRYTFSLEFITKNKAEQ